MNAKFKRFGIVTGAHILGIFLGTLLSALVNGISGPEAYLGAIILAPLEMTFGIILLFEYSTISGITVLIGFITALFCFMNAMDKGNRGAIWGMLVGSVLWSVGNIPAFYMIVGI